MPANIEKERPEVYQPQITEHQEEFPETIQAIQGARVIQKTFKSQVTDDNGKPLIQTPPTQVITTVQPPADQATLLQQSKGSKTNAATWLAAFWIRIIKKAVYFGWRIVSGNRSTTSGS